MNSHQYRKLAQGITLVVTATVAAMSAALAQAQNMAGNASMSNYFLASQVDWVPLIPAPPRMGSPQQQRGLQEVLDVQSAARQSPARRQQAIDDAEASCFRFADVLGAAFDATKLPRTAQFLDKAAHEGVSAVGSVKSYWKRPRPYELSDKVERLADLDPEYLKQVAQRQAQVAMAGSAPSGAPQARDNSAYPSGHATVGTLCGILLTQMLPEKQAELSARAAGFRESRMIVGGHDRADIEAGELLATAVAAVMSQNYAFQHDLALARVELRVVLGLPVELPRR